MTLWGGMLEIVRIGRTNLLSVFGVLSSTLLLLSRFPLPGIGFRAPTADSLLRVRRAVIIASCDTYISRNLYLKKTAS